MIYGRVRRIRRKLQWLWPGIRQRYAFHGYRTKGYGYDPAHELFSIFGPNEQLVAKFDLGGMSSKDIDDWKPWLDMIDEDIDRKENMKWISKLMHSVNKFKADGIKAISVIKSAEQEAYILDAVVNSILVVVTIPYLMLFEMAPQYVERFVFLNVMLKYHQKIGNGPMADYYVSEIHKIAHSIKTHATAVALLQAGLSQAYEDDYAQKQAALQQNYYQQQVNDPAYQQAMANIPLSDMMASYTQALNNYEVQPKFEPELRPFVQPAPPGMWLTPNVTVEDVT